MAAPKRLSELGRHFGGLVMAASTTLELARAIGFAETARKKKNLAAWELNALYSLGEKKERLLAAQGK